MMTENEKKFVRAFVDYEANLQDMEAYLKEHYDVSVEMVSEGKIKLITKIPNDINMLFRAKSYIEENFDSSMLTVIF